MSSRIGPPIGGLKTAQFSLYMWGWRCEKRKVDQYPAVGKHTAGTGTLQHIKVFGNGSELSRLHQRVLPPNFSLKVQIAQPQTHGAPIEHTMQTIMLHRDRNFCVLDYLQSWLQSQSPTALQQKTPEKIECLSIDEASA